MAGFKYCKIAIILSAFYVCVFGNFPRVNGPSDISIVSGNTAILECTATPFSDPYAIAWKIGDNNDAVFSMRGSGDVYASIGYDSIKHSDWFVDTSQTNHYDLHIPNASIGDEGRYFCGLIYESPGTDPDHNGYLSIIVPPTTRPQLNYNHGSEVKVVDLYQHTFTCTVRGTKPPATIEWFLEDVKLPTVNQTVKPNADPRLSDAISNLHIMTNLGDHDGKQLTCTASNVGSIDPVESYVTLIVQVPLSATPTISDKNSMGYASGDTVDVSATVQHSFTCIASGAKPAASIEWYLGSSEQTTDISETSTENPSGSKLHETTSTWVFTPQWKEEHNQLVNCRAKNEANTDYLSSSVALNLLVGNLEPHIENYNNGDTLNVTHNKASDLSCTATGRPAPTIQWLYGTVVRQGQDEPPVDNAEDHDLKDVTSRLTYTPNLNDEGKIIKCKSDNDADTKPQETYIYLEIQVIPSSVSVLPSGSSDIITLTHGVEEIFTCIAIGAKPKSSIQWYIGDEEQTAESETSRHNQQDARLQDTISTFKLTPHYERHQNRSLKCQARNEATVTDQANVAQWKTINVQISFSSLSFDAYNNGDNIVVTSDKATTLMCIASNSYPSTNIRWYLGDQDITSNATDVITWNMDGTMNTTSSLMLIPRKDMFGKQLYCEGNYVVQIIPRKIGLFAIVQYPTKILNKDQDKSSAHQGHNATLPCIASGFPMPKVSWYTDVNGVLTELVNGTDRITVVEERNYTGRYIRSLLSVTLVQPSQDYTTYKCIAENIVGNSTHDIVLTGTREPDPPTDISVIEVTWENITVIWTTGYDGGVPQYFVVGHRVSGTGDFDESQAIHESQYTLTELQPDTAYDIYIKARNNIDWSQPSETIVVVTSAIPLSPLNPPSGQSNTGIIAGLTTPLILLMVAFVTVLLILLRKGIIGRKVVREDAVELDYVNVATQQEVDKRLEATYEEIPQSSSKGKSSAGGLQKKMDKENDTYMDLVPDNFSENVYMKPDRDVRYNKESTYTDLSPNKRSDGIYMKIGQTAFEFPREMITIRNVLWSGKTHQIAVAKAWNIGGRKGITEVAVKKAKDGSDSDQEADILRESVLMKNIPSHPNVVQLLGVCTESAPTFILLEYLIQGNLWSTIEEVRSKFTINKKYEILTEKQLLSFTLDIAEGMKHLEEQGIVHRYLSPKHILVDWSLHCKISNFGYASNVIDSASFMAKAEGSCPERWMAIESLVDLKFTSKSDVWAFGVVLWHTMTLGETPYASINLIHLAEKLNAGYELPRPPICGQKLCDMIKQCCQISPLQRPKFEELASALNTYTNTAKAYLDLMSYPKHVGID